MGNSISVTILAKNSQQHLSACLSALHSFDEVIVLDNGSTDNSIAIARQFPNVKVIESPFIGFGPLKNLAAQYTSNSWILSIDSDEVLTEELKEELLKLDLSGQDIVYSFKRHNYYRNKLIDACGWGNDYVLRLYNKTKTGFADLHVHEYIRTEGLQVQLLPGILHHYSYDSISQLISKANTYTSLFASDNRFIRKSSPFKSCYKWAFSFFKNYILQQGFLYGYEGFTIAFTNAASSYYKYMKLYEANRTLHISVIIMQASAKIVWEKVKADVALQQVPPIEVITVTTGTAPEATGAEIIKVKNAFVPVRHLHSLNKQGAAALQEAAELATGEFIVVVDNVTSLTPDFLTDYKRNAKRGAFSCKLSNLQPTSAFSIGFWKEDLNLLNLSEAQPTEAATGLGILATQLQQNGLKQV